MRLVFDAASCNLMCFMCPRGCERGNFNTARGIMQPELLTRIIDKLITENIDIHEVNIGNWGEGTLNPYLPWMIQEIDKRLHPKVFLLYTNLTIHLANPEALVTSGLTLLRASISGMSQDIYSRNHRGGKIETVLNNLVRCSTIPNHCPLEMVWHLYRYNTHEQDMARQFCRENNITFLPHRCYIATVEEGKTFHINQKVQQGYNEYIDIEAEQSLMRVMWNNDWPRCRCPLGSDIVVNFDGTVFRCCATLDERYALGSIFDWKIQDLVNSHPTICKICRTTPLSFR